VDDSEEIVEGSSKNAKNKYSLNKYFLSNYCKSNIKDEQDNSWLKEFIVLCSFFPKDHICFRSQMKCKEGEWENKVIEVTRV
jgi:hypothetical protein